MVWSSFLYSYEGLFCDPVCDILKNVPCALEKKVCSVGVGGERVRGRQSQAGSALSVRSPKLGLKHEIVT